MKELKGRVAAITGGANGIGRATAIELARRGCHVALSDVDDIALREAKDEATEFGVDVRSDIVDVSDREAVQEWADGVVSHFGHANIIVNNAGVSLSATVEEMTYEDLEWLMGINFWGVVHGTKAFLPHLRASGEGHVVNVSSIFGIVSVPTQSAYHAAKFAVRGFTESLRTELEFEGAPVSATSVHPGGIQTGIVRKSRIGGLGAIDRTADDIIQEFESQAGTTPEKAARAIVKGILKDKRRVLIGGDARALDLVQRIFPSFYLGQVVNVLKRRWS